MSKLECLGLLLIFVLLIKLALVINNLIDTDANGQPLKSIVKDTVIQYSFSGDTLNIIEGTIIYWGKGAVTIKDTTGLEVGLSGTLKAIRK